MMIPKYGEKTQDVKDLQKALNKKGAKLKIDGDFGPKTKKAVSKFQKSIGLRGSGIIGPRTMKGLGLSTEVPKIKPGAKFKQKSIILKAYSQNGVREGKGSKNNPTVKEYLRYGSKNNNTNHPDSVPWCAGYIAWVLEKCGLKSTNNLMARSYEGHRSGFKNVTKMPLSGDIVTFYRNGKSSGSGHVAFFLKETPSYVYVIGGNQSDAVNIRRYSKAKMTGIWRAHRDEISSSQALELRSLATQMMAGKKINTGGSVT